MAGNHGVFGFSGRGPKRIKKEKRKRQIYIHPDIIKNPVLISNGAEVENVLDGKEKETDTPDVIVVESEDSE